MRILYIGQGITGSGHLVRGLSIFHGLKRTGWCGEFCIISSTDQYTHLAQEKGVQIEVIPLEDPRVLASQDGQSKELPVFIRNFKPDLILLNQHWFTLQPWLKEIPCPCWILFWQVSAPQLEKSFVQWEYDFEPSQWGRVLTTEPFSRPPILSGTENLSPIVILNPSEILTRDESRFALGISPLDDQKVALIAANGKTGEVEFLVQEQSSLEDQGFKVLSSSNLHSGFFPLMNYLNGVDLLITSAGYHGYWEARYLKMKARFMPFSRTHEDQGQRILDGKDYDMIENGADKLARMIGEL